ncbi:phosphatase PAP2 family protein [Phragmitibacter flavus]|uniref:Phosphatase PAP2 family protein n=1 Tax=Phragmitibacter flavus TaxID=2576071 RepID=A0A5R8K9W1_9BACT|nr:phosphatase PAP2 family protein [Phragmitibacter flavus]TLD69091.1 phosphatase PAP2 family protein [Phragmitibacter flavus]
MASIDLQLLDLINRQWTNPFFDRLMPLVSALNAWTPIMAIIVAVVWWQTRGRCWRVFVGAAICLMATEYVVSYPLKHFAGKQRPNESVSWVVKRDLAKHPVRFLAVFEEPVIKPAKLAPPGKRGKSFPSSHVLNTTGVLTFIYLAWRGWTVWLLGIPPILCWSRIYCGSHWPSDIPHSVIFAVLTAWVMHKILKKWLKLPQASCQSPREPLLPTPAMAAPTT